MKAYTKDEVLEVIEREIKQSSLRQVAREKGLSGAYLSDITLGKRGISEKVAAVFGFTREVVTRVTFRKAG